MIDLDNGGDWNRTDGRDWVVTPEQVIRRCLLSGMISMSESMMPNVVEAAQQTAEDLADDWPQDEGFGTSDFTFVAEKFLRLAGFSSEYISGRLHRKA